MLNQKIVTVDAGATLSVSYKVDFQKGVVIFTVIPVSEDETVQETKLYNVDVCWSNNGKYYVVEPMCELTVSSSGESLVTELQAVFCKVVITNAETTAQKFYVSVYVPSTTSSGVK